MTTRSLIYCPICDDTFEDALLFRHLASKHDLDFEMMEVPEETAELVMAFENSPVSAPLRDHLGELERISAMIDAEAWYLRPWHRWQLRGLRREFEDLRDQQLALMVEMGHDR